MSREDRIESDTVASVLSGTTATVHGVIRDLLIGRDHKQIANISGLSQAAVGEVAARLAADPMLPRTFGIVLSHEQHRERGDNIAREIAAGASLRETAAKYRVTTCT